MKKKKTTVKPKAKTQEDLILNRIRQIVNSEVIKVAIYLLLFRLASTFFLALYFGETWHIEMVWKVIPVIVFSSDTSVFTIINSYSIIATTALMFIGFTYQIIMTRFRLNYKTIAWYMGMIMCLIQYFVAIVINELVQYSADPGIWKIIFLLFGISTALFYFFGELELKFEKD